MYLDTNRKTECYGCSACSSICPKSVIEMRRDNEGFLYPLVVDETQCTHCNLCRKVCPVDGWKATNIPTCYLGFLRDSEKRRLSTSGGAFMAIAEWAHDNGYEFFYGATYDEKCQVSHKEVTFDEIELLRGTKYVQSEMSTLYKEAKQRIISGHKVMFVGTPCQVNGLQKYVGGKYRNSILTVSLVCHGVASPAAFKKYVEEMKSTIHGDVHRVVFRDKVEGRPDNVPSYTTLEYADGYKDSQALNPYTTAFGLGLMQRPSCSACQFTTVKRDCDLTIGDFWGIEDYQPGLSTEVRYGISLILAHSDTGKNILSELRGFYCEEKPLEWAVNTKQPQLTHPHEVNPRREKFMRTIMGDKQSFMKAAGHEILRWRIKKKVNEVLLRKED